MNKIKFIILTSLILASNACDQKVKTFDAKTAEKFYNSLSDEQIIQHSKSIYSNSCQQMYKTFHTEIKNRFSGNTFCDCYTNKLISKLDIDTLRLMLLPEESLNQEQKREIDEKSLRLSKQIIPQCLN